MSFQFSCKLGPMLSCFLHVACCCCVLRVACGRLVASGRAMPNYGRRCMQYRIQRQEGKVEGWFGRVEGTHERRSRPQRPVLARRRQPREQAKTNMGQRESRGSVRARRRQPSAQAKTDMEQRESRRPVLAWRRHTRVQGWAAKTDSVAAKATKSAGEDRHGAEGMLFTLYNSFS